MKSIGLQLVDNTDQGTILDLKITPKRDENGKIIQGLVIGKTLQQNIALLLTAQKGEFKRNPSLGVGLEDILLGDTAALLEYRHRIRGQFALDGLSISKLQLYPNKPIEIIADYE